MENLSITFLYGGNSTNKDAYALRLDKFKQWFEKKGCNIDSIYFAIIYNVGTDIVIPWHQINPIAIVHSFIVGNCIVKASRIQVNAVVVIRSGIVSEFVIARNRQ